MSERSPILIVVSAPSGTGKSTILKRVLESFPGIRPSVSHTTRPPRPGEADGVEYHFVSPGEFQKLIESGTLLEWAEVHGHRYGTAVSEYERALADGVDLITDLDVQGAAQVRQKVPDAVTVFILPPSYRDLEKRLRGRAKDGDDEIARRLAVAIEEIKHYREYDHVIVNDSLEECVKDLKGVIRATRSRITRADKVAQSILQSFEGRKES